MKRTIKLSALILTAALCIALAITGCANPDGLHNLQSSTVIFVFKNFSTAQDGDYSIPGEHNNWDNTVAVITLKDGQGTSSPVTLPSTETKFSLCPVNEWTRPWFVAGTQEGNADDNGKMQNFWVGGIPAGSEVTVLIDGSSITATPVVQ